MTVRRLPKAANRHPEAECSGGLQGCQCLQRHHGEGAATAGCQWGILPGRSAGRRRDALRTAGQNPQAYSSETGS